MQSDYKSLVDREIFSRRRPQVRLAILLSAALLVAATVLFASLRLFAPDEEAVSAKTPAGLPPLEAADPKEEASGRAKHLIPLALPEPAAPATATIIDTATEPLPLPRLPDGPLPTDEKTAAPDSEEPAEGPTEASVETPVLPGSVWKEEQVKSGDSLARIFSRLGLSASLLHRITHSSAEAKQLAKIRPGQTLRVQLDAEEQLTELVLQRSPVESVRVVADGDGFSTTKEVRELEVRTTHTTGVIARSLYESALEAGLPDALIMDLANIFGWDIDFALEIREGDSFSLIYEETYLDGEKFGNGAILAAEFINRGKSFRAVRYEDESGRGEYFSPDGKSMRKSFLRAPVDFRRISSRFTRERYHPVLGKKRPHRGVDYAAATGTPIKAAGDGKVIFRGTKGGYGRTVIIQHANQYTTLYAHLSKYRGSVKNGSRVKQGDVIGYVGKSGLATGPHLHYEFRVNGVHRNPLTVKLPAAAPIAAKYKGDFQEKSASLLARLDLISRTRLADAR